MDHKFLQWEEQLPVEYRLDNDTQLHQEYNGSEQALVSRQRYHIQSWYLAGRLRLRLTAFTGIGRGPQEPRVVRQCQKESVLIALSIIRLQTQTYMSDTLFPGNCWFFDGFSTLFEACIGLCATLRVFPWQEKLAEAKYAIETSMTVFRTVKRREQRTIGEMATRAIDVLSMICAQQWPSAGPSSRGDTVTFDPSSSSPPLDLNASIPMSVEAPFSNSMTTQLYHLSSVRENADIAHMPDYSRPGG